MACWSNIDVADPSGDSGVFTKGGAQFPGVAPDFRSFYLTCFCPTARTAEDLDGVIGSKAMTQVRTNTNCFARGYKEITEISTITGVGWQWRRICFTMKGDTLTEGVTDPQTSRVFRETSDGYARLVTILTNNRAQDLLFKGEQNVDWTDPMTAPLDTRRVSLRYDKLRHIKSNNQSGTTRVFKEWFPMNKNIYYEDEERGSSMNESPFSVENKQGMGDYYIVDIFAPNRGATSADNLTFTPQGRYYWHEK